MVSVILPTYNEATHIEQVIGAIAKACSDLPFEIVIIDDDSTDQTVRIARGLSELHHVRAHVRRGQRGLASAVMKGFALAEGDVCLVMDADLSHPAGSILDMIQPVLDNRCDVTIGSRYMPGGRCENWPLARQILSRISGVLAKGLTPVFDPTSGFMAVRRSILSGACLDPVGWKIALEVIVKTKPRVLEVPIVFSHRRGNQSKASLRTGLEYLCHLLRLYAFKYPGLRRMPRSLCSRSGNR